MNKAGRITVVYSPGCKRHLSEVARMLWRTYGMEAADGGTWPDALGPADGVDLLLEMGRRLPRPALLLTDVDISFGDSWVMGLAHDHGTCLVSSYRIGTTGMMAKESVHEVGHLLGLGHCPRECVMHFSRTVAHAIDKPTALCHSCKSKLK